jgi:hypothetical protein
VTTVHLAVHLVERVLPHVPYRQWTLSFAHRVRGCRRPVHLREQPGVDPDQLIGLRD